MRGTSVLCLCILTAALLLPTSTCIHHDRLGGQTHPVCQETCSPPDMSTCPLETPQVEDRVLDVKLFGLLPVLPQWGLRHVDIVSTTFEETPDEPSWLYPSMELRDLLTSTLVFEAVYAVGWSYNNLHYSTLIHVRPDGVHDFLVGRSIDGDDDIEQWETCEGTYDADADVITWKLPKTAVGDPSQGARLVNIHPHTHLRPTGDTAMPPVDLFKDLVHNARTTADYTIQY